jgi:CheY-like chemotaxis protein
LQENAKLKNIPVVVLTGTVELPDIKESLRLGVRAYVAKPIEFADLVRVAEELNLSWMLLKKG